MIIQYFLLLGCIEGLKLSKSFFLNSVKDPLDHSCTNNPKGEWHETNGTEILEKFWQMQRLYPNLCQIDKGPDVPCSDSVPYSATYFSECMSQFDATAFLKTLEGKTLSLIGDSIMGQLFERIACAMVPVQHEIAMIDRSYDPKHIPKGVDLDEGYSTLSFKNGAKVQFQYIASEWNMHAQKQFNPWILKEEVFDADVLVVNVGAHIKSQKQMDKVLKHLHTKVSTSMRPGARLIWREYMPSHFNSGDWYQVLDSKKLLHKTHNVAQGCGPSAHMTEMANVRLNYANKVMQDLGWEILKTYDIASSRWEQHKSGLDCRHWCQPSPVLDATKTVLANLLSKW